MTPPPPRLRSGLPRAVFILGGLLFVGLGVIGAFLPILPTTPFLLLALFCFARSSPRLHHWLLHSPFFGPYLQDWQKHRGVRRRVKVMAISMVVGVVSLTLWLTDLSWFARGGLITLALIGITVILSLKTIAADALREEAKVDQHA
ncbi:MAG TPA: YbaN family protein [Gemmatales bacterium]|nr:YbaN family protein [Gemmatales bacterium]HMP59328.1 YbaN family protein [Gemmatales bacterium]